MVLLPETVRPETQVRIHLHGFSQNPNGSAYNSTYDISLNNGKPAESFEKTINAYGMQRSVCGRDPQILVVPISYYRCDDYKKSFATQDDFNTFLSEVETKLQHPIGRKQLVISAHSGGGNRLSQMMVSADPRISKVLIFDGLYDGSQNIFDWLSLSADMNVKLINLFKVDGIEGEPYGNSNELIEKFEALLSPVTHCGSIIGGENFSVDDLTTPRGVRIRNITQKENPTLNHWGIVRTGWNL